MTNGAASDSFELVGSVVDRQFRVDSVIGEGGFAVVYKGWHLSLDQPIAIKALKMPGAHDAGLQGTLLAKFREEAKLTYVLSQATLNIVRIIDFGATTAPNGAWVPFAVQEWLDGETLAQDLRRRREQGMRGRPLAEAMRILEPAARALAIAHQRRVVHRDVKPGNIFLLSPASDTQGLLLKVLDFGIAKVIREGSLTGVASMKMVSFTPQYASPEQIDPRHGPVWPSSDVYSLALVMTELLTDRRAVEGEGVASLLGQVVDPHRRPTPRARGALVPDAVEAVMARALSVDPRMRPGDAEELWGALVAASMPAPPSYGMPPPSSLQGVAHYGPSSQPYPGTPYAPHPVPGPTGPGGHRTATVIAIVVGVGLGLLVLLALATWIVTRR